MNYIKLSPFVFYCGDTESGCLYHTFEGKAEPLHGSKNGIIYKVVCERTPYNEILELYGDVADIFVESLIANGTAYVYETDVYIDPNKLVSDWEIRGHLEKPMDLDKLYIQVTDECNFDCVICSENAIVKKCNGCFKWKLKDSQLPLDKFLGILRQFCTMKIDKVVFSGGNPLMSWARVLEIICYLKKEGLQSEFIVKTNGTYLSENIISDCKEHGIVLDFIMAEHGSSTIHVINKLNNRVKYKTSTVLCKETALSFDSEPNEVAEVIDKDRVSTTIKTFYERINTGVSNISERKKYSTCLSKTLAISMSGKLLPCPAFDECIGDLTDENLLDMFQKQKQDKFTRLSKDCMDICKKCPFRYLCVDCTHADILANNGIIDLLCSKPENFTENRL